MEKKPVMWLGTIPANCDICQEPIKDEFTDGRTVDGPWANMCLNCFVKFGVGLGTGCGQRYRKTDKGFMKVGG